MLVKFKGEHTGSFVMFGEVAGRLLKMMGMSGNLEGALNEKDVPGALDHLEAAIGSYQEPPAQDSSDDDDDDANVSLKTRALPLLDLLRAAKTAGGYVMWRQQD